MADDIQKELHDLKSDVSRLASDVAGFGGAVKDSAAESMHRAARRIRDDVDNAQDVLKERVDLVREKGRQVLSDLEGQIAEHPLASVLTAFGVGFILAKLMGRRSRS